MSEADETERRALEYLLDAARSEAPSERLHHHILDQLAYRARLQNIAAPQRRRGLRVGGALLGLCAAAALFLAIRRPSPAPPISAENAPSPGAAHAPSATASSAAAHPARLADSACAEPVVASGSDPLIDDFEDGDDSIRPLEGRVGFWRWAREIDAAGSAPALIPVPRPDAKHGNRLAQHVKGGQLVDWGATVEFDFRPACYDASNYGGVSFQARGPGRIYFAARERSVIPIAEGGSCEADCHNPHVAKIELDAAWRTYQVRWSELRQRGAISKALDTQRLHSLAFLIRPEDTPYDVWLDDVRFLQR
jgi:hypothetical protein